MFELNDDENFLDDDDDTFIEIGTRGERTHDGILIRVTDMSSGFWD